MRVWQLLWERLAVLFLDAHTRAPIARMPVYAELSLLAEAGVRPVPEEAFDEPDDYLRDERLGPALRGAIARALGEGGFEALEPRQRAALTTAIRGDLSDQPDVRSLEPLALQEAAERVVEAALAQVGIAEIPPPRRVRRGSIPLGFIATDHVGYASFDLAPVRRMLAEPTTYGGPGLQFAIDVYPMGSEGERLDALAQGRLTRDAIYAKFEIERPSFEPDLRVLSLPSMQNPDLIDWRLSPGSFTAQPDLLLGADGCETLAPSQLSLHEYTLNQVVRLTDALPRLRLPAGARAGFLDQYRVSWHALGHSLGEITYSLPLAPGESVKLALVDWTWESSAEQREETLLSEALMHETHRDRVIDEAVRATLEEWQRGGTLMGGVAGSAGASGSTGALGLAAGSSMALGGSYSTSSGSRALAGENVQRLSDGFSQHSSSLRALTSTVVVQAHQAEHEAIQTRTFTNYNHAHTLTILYYELLRHFRVVTDWIRRRPVALLPAPPVVLDDAGIVRYRRTLEGALLDVSLAPAFDALEQLLTVRGDYARRGVAPGPVPRPFAQGDLQFTLFELLIKTADGLGDKSTAKIVGFVRLVDGSAVALRYLYNGPHYDDPHDLNSGDLFDDTSWAGIYVKPDVPVRWRDVAGFELEKWGRNEWRVDRIGLTGFSEKLQIPLIPFDTEVDLFFRNEEPSPFSITFIKRPDPDPAAPPPIPTPEQTLSAEQARLIARLRDHLAAESAHYWRAIALARDPDDIARAFARQPWDASSSVLDHVEPYPLETFGDLVAYPLVAELDELRDPDGPPDAHSEKLVTFPARGVFAEGKLGHCNVAEEIDDTRFWRWEEHPPPVQAPEIAAATPVTPAPQATDTRPTPLPASLLNIVNPTAAPDPTGLAAALTLLGTPNIFRDMSGRAEVADLLKRLSDNSISIADAANRARAIQSRYGSDLSGGGTPGTGGTTSAGGGTGAGAARPSTPSELQQFGNTLKSGVGRGLISDEAAARAYQQAVDGYVQTGYEVPSGSSAELTASLQDDEKRRRAELRPEAVAAFTPSREDRLVGFGVEYAPPAGLAVVNWARAGLDHYGSMWRGRRVGGRVDITSGPITYALRALPIAVVVHETTGWARVGAGFEPARDEAGQPVDYGLSVHFTVGPDGVVYQHNDLVQRLEHATKANRASVGIEITNRSVWDSQESRAPPARPTGATTRVASEQTSAIVGGDVAEDRERFPVAWVDGRTDRFLFAMPPNSQMEAVAQLIAWLCPGNRPPFQATFVDARAAFAWRPYVVRTVQQAGQPVVQHTFLLHHHPVWTTKGYDAFDGIYSHANFEPFHSDGGAFTLYAWLRLYCGKSVEDAYTTARNLLTDARYVTMVEVAPGQTARGVNVADAVPRIVTL